jgi:uncharacterized protein DUF968
MILQAIAVQFVPGRPQKPARDSAYLRWIRSLPSLLSGRYGCDACHTGAHGIGQKASDYLCIPLTRKEHREFDKGPRAYAEKHGLDVAAAVARLNAEYRRRAA